VQGEVCAVRLDKPVHPQVDVDRGKLDSFFIRCRYGIILSNCKSEGGCPAMSIPKKMDRQTANEIRSILTKINITQSKVKIDLDNDTIQVEDDYSIDDILESAGVLTPEQAKHLTEEVKKMREEEWN
jgi:antitoxin component of MazEF toxin-antitoxin module